MARTSFPAFFIRSIAILGVLFAAFVFYNHFLIDHSLERIRTALNDVSGAGETGGQSGAYLFQDLLISEIAKPGQDMMSNSADESLWPGESAQKSSAQFLLEDLLSSYQKSRPFVFRLSDSVSRLMSEQINQVVRFSKFLFKPGSQRKSSPLEDAQLDALRRARELEFQWKFDHAAQAYDSFIKNHPSYQSLDLIRINLASVYLRSGRFDAAEKTLNEVRISLASAGNVKLVSSLKKKLKEQKEFSQKRADLVHAIDLSKSGARAQEWFEIGMYDLRLFDLQNARNDFEKALHLNPDTETEKRAKWMLSRIQLLQNDFQGNRRQMRELLEALPGTSHSI